MIENASLSGDVDLSDYYTKDEIDNKGFITSIFASEILNFGLSLKKLLDLEKSW